VIDLGTAVGVFFYANKLGGRAKRHGYKKLFADQVHQRQQNKQRVDST